MAFNFPDGAVNGNTYTASNGLVYVYNGEVWLVQNAGTVSSLDTKYAASGSYETTGRGIISSSTQLPSGLVSSSTQIISNLPAGTISSSTQLPSGIVSSSLQTTGWGYAITGSNTFYGNQTINGDVIITGSLTAQNLIFSSSVYHTTASFSSGSTIFGNTMDDTHLFTGSVSITGSLTASLQTGYAWVGNGNNVSVEFPTASLLSTASFNSWTGSTFNTLSSSVLSNQQQINALTASLGSTSNAFSYTAVLNPTAYVLVTYPTASFNGGVIDILLVNTANATATSAAYQFASFGIHAGISQNGKQTSGAGAPSPSMTIAQTNGNIQIRVSETGTFNIKGVARLF